MREYANSFFQIEAKDISEAKGFTSLIFRVVVEFESRPQTSFIMKVPTMDRINQLFKALNMDKVGFYSNFKNFILNLGTTRRDG